MSDRNKSEDNPLAEILNHGFWKTWPGRILAVLGVGFVAKWLLPVDALLKQVGKPGLAAAGKVLHVAVDDLVLEPLHKLWKYVLGIVLVGVILFVISLGLGIEGINRCGPYWTGAAGLIWTAYLVFCLLNIRFVGLTLAELVQGGGDVTQGILGKLLQKIGLETKKTKDEDEASGVKTVNHIAKIGQYVVAASLGVTTLLVVVTALAVSPPWREVGVLFIAALAALTAVSISIITELRIETAPTWRSIQKAMKWVAIASGLLALAVVVFPSLWQGVVGSRQAVDHWVAKPSLGHWWRWVVVAIPVLGYAVAAIAAAYYGGKKDAGKQGAWKTVGLVSIVAALLAAIIMMATGALTKPMIEGSARRFWTGSENPAAATTGTQEEATPIPAPAPKPDFTGVTDEDLLKRL